MASRPGGRIGTLLRTAWHLRVDQLVHQVYYRTLRPLAWARADRRQVTTPGRRQWTAAWNGPAYLPRRETAPNVFTMLGCSYRTVTCGDWNDANRPRLWLYECHYLDDLAARATDGRAEPDLLDRWIAANDRVAGVGWEPYPLSRRIVNIVKYLGRAGIASETRMQSLARQTRTLEDRLEYHLRGNHLLANAKALVFAGVFCSGADADRWLTRGVTLLLDQVQEQFLPDGGHFERSPMYHGLVLWDLCDLVDLSLLSNLEEIRLAAAACRPVIARGLAWLAAMCHPDGDVSFFNDSTFGVAPTLAQLRAYAGRHAIEAVAVRPPDDLTVLHESGFRSVACRPGERLLIDVGSVGPAYQPGHAHAGTLSLELSIRGRRVVVNSGISTYAAGPQRSLERGTAAHSTVEVDGRDSSEVWSAFRVGRRARITDSGQQTMDGMHEVWATHDGYAHLSGRPLHTRRCVLGPGRLTIVDRLSAPVSSAVARFFLHPDVRADDPCGWVLSDGCTVRVSISGGRPMICAAAWHPGFGLALPTMCIEIPFTNGELVTELVWES
jgi:uncharacterized heparinase superfamily protein